jgi:hypothetical protein
LAIPARIIESLDAGMARAESGGVIEQIDVQLVVAAAGDCVLVHAGVAIANIVRCDYIPVYRKSSAGASRDGGSDGHVSAVRRE